MIKKILVDGQISVIGMADTSVIGINGCVVCVSISFCANYKHIAFCVYYYAQLDETHINRNIFSRICIASVAEV